MEHSTTHASHAGPAGNAYNVNFQVSDAPRAGVPLQLSFVVTEQRVGDPLDAFDLLHDRLMHLIVVNESLSYFAHVHPRFADGTFTITHVFPAEGRYKLWSEAKPAEGPTVLAAFRLTVAAGTDAPDLVRQDAMQDVSVALSPSGKLPLHETVELTFEVTDRRGSAVTDLEPLMAAGGHCVIISSDLREFIHVHPAQEVESTWRGGPRVSFLTSFHQPVRHKVWGQFQRAGRTITAAFDVEVEDTSRH